MSIREGEIDFNDPKVQKRITEMFDKSPVLRELMEKYKSPEFIAKLYESKQND